jgi:uncharacterized protein with beta-barrel porin domain
MNVGDVRTALRFGRAPAAAEYLRPRFLSARRGAFLSATALAGAMLFGALTAMPALADGGTGGGSGGGGAGGVDSATGAGGNGASSIDGGGGGGAGATGGSGGSSSGAGAGGAGGATAGAAGSTGGSDLLGGGGGGGGAHGFVGAGLPGTAASGGAGGAGGDSDGNVFGAGGGGAGGWGAVITGSGNLGTLTVPLTGGRGGNGGSGDNLAGDLGANGGSGGIGLALTGTSPVVTINANVIGGDGGSGGGRSGSGGAGGQGGAGGAGLTATGASVTINTGATVAGGNGGAGGPGSGGPTGSAGVGGVGVTGSNLTIINNGTISGGLSGDNTTRANAITFTGGTNALELQAGSSITGNVVAFSSADTLRLGGTSNASFDVSLIGTQYQNFGIFQKTGSSTWTLTGTNSAVLPWTINAGTLSVNGTMSNSTMTVNSGGTLAGTGTVGATTINSGGTLAPGNSPGTITIAGNLAFQSGALYLVQVNSSTASSANVSGTATLTGASVQTVFAPGSYVTRQYTILHSGGLIGTFSGVSGNVPAGFNESLSYTGTDVILNLTANLAGVTAAGPGALGCFNVNQCNVATAINNFFNNGGALPPNFAALFNLTGANLANALTLLSGEPATGAQQPAFQLMNQFLGIMLDPFVDGRAGVGGVYGYALPFAPDREPLPEDIALAYSKVLRTPVTKAPLFEQRWSVWGAGYGGSNRTSGDPLIVGSHDLSASVAGGAAGLDYRLAPGTVVGFALAGGGTGWRLAQGLGSGGSDAFQAGVYGTTRSGPFYLAGALAYTQHWMSTDRFAFAGDHLFASFNAESFGGRAEAGYRIPSVVVAITPYAAVQAQNFHTPTYSETDITGGGFGLTYAARNATDTRSELGARFDKPFLLNWNAVLALRGKVAWAHDWISDPSLMPAFEALPGASFVVNGATPAKNSALTSAGAELRLINGVSLLGKFDGEFARTHRPTRALAPCATFGELSPFIPLCPNRVKSGVLSESRMSAFAGSGHAVGKAMCEKCHNRKS